MHGQEAGRRIGEAAQRRSPSSSAPRHAQRLAV